MIIPRPGSGVKSPHQGLAPVTQSGMATARPDASRGMSGYGGTLSGLVVRIDVANNTIDVSLSNGGIMHSVPVLIGLAGTTEGIYGLPSIKTPKKKSSGTAGTSQQEAGTQGTETDEQEDDSDGRVDWKDIKDADLDNPSGERDVYAAIVYMNGNVRTPLCIGFVPPHSTQMSINDRQEKMEDRLDYLCRLTSTWYELHTRGGVYEDDYPDGTHLRVGKPKEKKKKDSNETQQQAGAQADSSNSSSSSDDYYDDDDDDPDGRIVLGKDEYENLDKDDKPWTLKKVEDGFRWVVVHGVKGKFGFTEKGQFFFQDYNNKKNESDPPDDYEASDSGDYERSEHKYNIGDQDAHQTRMWRSAWGDWEDLPDEDKAINGEHLWDSKAKRDRYLIPEESDGDAGDMDDNRRWYTPGATPTGGGVKKQIKKITLKDHDYTPTGDEGELGSTDGDSLDASDVKHQHTIGVAKDADIKPTNLTMNKGGTADYTARGDHEHRDSSSSDERLKNNLGVLKNVLPALNELNAIRFTWNELANDDDKEIRIGLIAQEVNLHFPELVVEVENGYLALDYKKFTAVLLSGLQETNKRIDRIEQMLGMN